MKLIQLFSILIIISSIFGGSIKPENSNDLDFITIINKNNNKYRYYHLDNNGEIIFDDLERILRKDKNYIIKIMARTPISKNSNSNKTFGFNLNIKNKGKTIINDVLKYKKKVSSSIRPDENGLYYTDAGYWVEEIFSPNNLKIKIKSLKTSPDTYIKVTYKEINSIESKNVIYPVSQKVYNTLFLSSDIEPTKKSTKWYEINNNNNKMQYKIVGPKYIQVRTRAIIDSTKENYQFNIYEDGYKKGEHLYQSSSPKNEVYILDDDNNKIQLTKQDYLNINVPAGTHYYSFKKSKKSSKMYVKVESYSRIK